MLIVFDALTLQSLNRSAAVGAGATAEVVPKLARKVEARFETDRAGDRADRQIGEFEQAGRLAQAKGDDRFD